MFNFEEVRPGERSRVSFRSNAIYDDTWSCSAEFNRIYGDGEWWLWAVPVVYRALYDHTNLAPLPAIPPTAKDGFSDLGYWVALKVLLTYHLGWTQPVTGLAWWASAGRPRSNAVLSLVDDLWVADGAVEQFCRGHKANYVHDGSMMADFRQPKGAELRRTTLDRYLAQIKSVEVAAPYRWADIDSMHFEIHTDGPAMPFEGEAQLVLGTSEQRRGVLRVDRFTGWYSALKSLDLPDIGFHSWYIDVVVEPLGFIGTFRRSRETGLWFSGQHSVHVQGN